jgi:hypothetical protein
LLNQLSFIGKPYTMAIKKSFYAVVISSILGMQVYTILPGSPEAWYWPFINYPMYSAPTRPGDKFRIDELRVIPCGQGSAIRLSHRDLHVTYFAFLNLLENATRRCRPGFKPTEHSQAATELLSRLIVTQSSISCSNLQIWSKNFVIGVNGVDKTDPPWELTCEWDLNQQDRQNDRALLERGR